MTNTGREEGCSTHPKPLTLIRGKLLKWGRSAWAAKPRSSQRKEPPSSLRLGGKLPILQCL